MARQYPRFLFSNPQNTKSKGAFVIHTMEPHIIIGIYDFPIDKTKYNILREIEPKPQFRYILARLNEVPKMTNLKDADKYHKTLVDMQDWIYHQLKDGHISL